MIGFVDAAVRFFEIIESEFSATKERDEILTFLRNSQRGIMKGYFKSN